jgi:hypothetical protein
MTTSPMHERNHPVTTAPTLLGPDGQALTPSTPPQPAGDWKPVRTTGNAVTWERPRPAAVPVPDIDPLEETRAEAAQLLADARAEAEHIIGEARSLRARTLGSADHEARTIRDQAAAEVARKEDKGRKLDTLAARAVIAGAVGLTAFGEYSLARLAHFPKEVAWLLPFVIDVYVIQAFRRHRDIAQAISLTIVANVVYHLAAAGMFGVTVDPNGKNQATWWLIAMVSSIASVILWRMHVMTAPPREKKRRRSTGTEAPAQAVLGTPSEPVPAAPQTGTGTGDDQQERTPVPPPVPAASTASVPAPSTAPVPAVEPVLDTPSVPALKAVPEPGRRAVPRRRGTAPKTRRGTGRGTGRGTAPKTGTSTASFEEHVTIARGWLKDKPDLSGADIGKRLGTGDSYGRRVKRAASGEGQR